MCFGLLVEVSLDGLDGYRMTHTDVYVPQLLLATPHSIDDSLYEYRFIEFLYGSYWDRLKRRAAWNYVRHDTTISLYFSEPVEVANADAKVPTMKN